MRYVATGLLACAGASVLLAQVAPPAAGPGKTSTAPSKTKAGEEAAEFYDKLVSAYMKEKWTDFADIQKSQAKHNPAMTPEQRANCSYMGVSAGEFRPPWWKSCMSTSNVSFQAKIWNRPFVANYMPTDMMGAQAAIGIRDGKLQVIVTWRPNWVDNPKDAEGELSKRHGFTKGNLGQVVVWHELGHNYITNFLPLPHVVELYNNHFKLFEHLQELYADLTCLYHCGPRGRLVTMMVRLDDLASSRELEGHARASYAISALILAEALSNPAKWPSFHLPGDVPEKDVERKAVIYLYENIDPNWSLAEDKALRELVQKFIVAQGETVLRTKGEIRLPSKLIFRLMEPDDREYLPKRDAWVKAQLQKAVADGRADKPVTKGDPATRAFRQKRIEIPFEN